MSEIEIPQSSLISQFILIVVLDVDEHILSGFDRNLLTPSVSAISPK